MRIERIAVNTRIRTDGFKRKFLPARVRGELRLKAQMSEFLIALAIGVIITVVLRAMVWAKTQLMEFSALYRDKFYESAEVILQWDSISESRLSDLAWLSENVRRRRAQFMAIEAINRGLRATGTDTDAIFRSNSDLSPEQRHLWSVMYFRWLVAVCSQGSIIGAGALLRLLKYFGEETLDPKIENALLKFQHA